MGGSQSTSSTRAAKFSGNHNTRRSVRAVQSAPSTQLNSRRATSCRNTGRNVKEFSKFWSDASGVTRTKSSTRTSKRQVSAAASGNSIRRNRAQSVEVRRASSCLPTTLDHPNNGIRGSNQRNSLNARRATSFRCNTPSVSSKSQLMVGQHKSKNDSYSEMPRNFGKSDVYSAEFNQAAIAAARLKRLSLTPYLPDFHNQSRSSSPISHNRKYTSEHSSHLKTPETVIY